MSFYTLRGARLSLGLAIGAGLVACGSLDGVGSGVVDALSPYKVEVVQGNFVSREQVSALQPGMTRLQVRELLGTPLVTSVFHADRWDYVFTMRRQGLEPQSRKLTVFFKGDALDRFEGDEMPTEADFVSGLDSRRKSKPVPVLQASEEALEKFPVPQRAAPAEPAQPTQAPAPVVYPPLEPAAR